MRYDDFKKQKAKRDQRFIASDPAKNVWKKKTENFGSDLKPRRVCELIVSMIVIRYPLAIGHLPLGGVRLSI